MRDRQPWIPLALVLLACAPGLASAQIGVPAAPPPPPPPAQEEKSEPAPPTAYTLGEITLRAQETRRRVEQARSVLEPSPAIAAIEQELPNRKTVLENAQRNTEAQVKRAGVALDQLIDLEREWTTRAQSLDAWEQTITDRLTEVDGEIAVLRDLNQRWTLTRTAMREADTATAVETASEMLGLLKDADQLAQARAKAVLELGRQVDDAEIITANSLSQVRQARTARRALLFDPDAPPLWRVFESQRSIEAVQGDLREDLTQEWAAVQSYADLRGPQLVQVVVFGFLLFLGSLALQRRIRQWTDEDPKLDEAARLFRYPVSIATLGALLLAALWLQFLPAILNDLLAMVLLVPAVRLVPSLVPPSMRPVIFAVAVSVVITEIRDVLDAAPVLTRLLLTVEILGIGIFIAWLLRPRRLAAIQEPQRVWPILGAGTRLLLALTIAAFVLNVVGYLGLAALLIRGVVVTAYAGVAFYAAYRISRIAVRVILHTDTARLLRMVRVAADRIERTFGQILALGAIAGWIHITLGAYAIRDMIYAALDAIFSAEATVGALALSLGDVLSFAVVVFLAFSAARLVRFVLEEDVFPRFTMQRGVPNAITTTAYYTVLLLGLGMALSAAGVELSRITILVGAFGVGIGFGLQNVVNNFVSGLILLFERPIQVGDTIEVQGLMGEVRHIGARSSTVRTFDGAEVIVPNGTLISDNVINWTLSDRRRRVILAFNVVRGTDPERVLELLAETAAANERILQDPSPLIRFCGYSEGALAFELRVWIPRFEEGFGIQTELWTDLERRLHAAGIEVPRPQRDLRIAT